jgi:uncharacterized protein (TIGR02594 family)
MKLYRAVIENNISPKKDGRVQVRVIGIHDSDKNKVKTEHLPWAEVMQSTAFGFGSGVGFSSIPNIGTWVFVIMDHDNPNMFIVIGAISGKSAQKSDPSLGFNSPDGIFPLEDRLNEEDQNRLQRVENLDKTIHKTINDNIDEVTKTDSDSGADVTMTEPNSLSDLSLYPDNAVIETKSGHIIEIDDSPNNEKIRIIHRTGSYFDMRPDGSIVHKTVSGADNYYIHSENINTHIEKCVKKYVEGNIDKIVEGYIKESVGEDKFSHIAGLFTIQADGHLLIDNDVKITGGLEVEKKVTATLDISSKAEVADMKGNLSSLRDAYDKHNHIQNNGNHYGGGVPTAIPTTTDPIIRWGDYSWEGASISSSFDCSIKPETMKINRKLYDAPKPYQTNASEVNTPETEASSTLEVDEGQVNDSNFVVPMSENNICSEIELRNPLDLSLEYTKNKKAWIETSTNENITNIWKEIGYVSAAKRFTENHTAWCAVYVSAVLKRTGYKYLQTASSQAYKNYGTEITDLSEAKAGDIIVFYRNGENSGFGHVGFYTGSSTADRIDVLGGNQGNALKVSSFSKSNPSKGWGIKSIRRPEPCDENKAMPDSTYKTPGSSGNGGQVT